MTYPVRPLVEYAGGAHHLCAHLHISGSTLRSLVPGGLSADQADNFATRLGVHPSEIWPTWWDDWLTPADRIFIPMRARAAS